MVNDKDLQVLVDKGAITIQRDGVRVIDASCLNQIDLPNRGEDIRKNISKRKQYPKSEPKRLVPPVIQPEIEIEEEPTEKKVILPPDLKKQQVLNNNFERKGFIMTEESVPKGVGLDVGTSFLVAGRFENDGKIHFKKFRDCFLELEPKSPINKKLIKKGLDDRQAPYVEADGSFYVLGEDAFLMANERHVSTRRPMQRGVLAPQEKQAFPILKELITRLVGEPKEQGERLVFSVPAKPIDADFDQLFHQDMLRSFLNSLGYNAQPMNEAEALAYSELLEDGLTGIAISCGGGMINVVVMSSGDPVVAFSLSKSGDWIDHQAAIATNMTNSIIQQEKEGPDFDLANPEPGNHIHAAISVYYGNLLVYTLQQIAYDLGRSPSLPRFKEAIPLVVGGGTSLPKGFINKFEQALGAVKMPIKIKEVRHAGDPLFSVAHGLALAASMD